MRLESASGLVAQISGHGGVRLMSFAGLAVNLFVGGAMEAGPANLWLRRRTDAGWDCAALLGPASLTRFEQRSAGAMVGRGEHGGLQYEITLQLSTQIPAWAWFVVLDNTASRVELDLIHVQDIALAPYDAVRLNEYYVSQYVDHTPLMHPDRGWVIASRQNLAVGGAHPWAVIGSLRSAVAFATDGLQVYGLAGRAGAVPQGVSAGLPGRRRQHEHSMPAVQDAPVVLERGDRVVCGFFGRLLADHPSASSPVDLEKVDQALAAIEAPSQGVKTRVRAREPETQHTNVERSLFTSARLFPVLDLTESQTQELFGPERRWEERDGQGRLLSFFHASHSHVVMRAKELQVQRPHGRLLRTGRRLAPDEAALTSTAWMGGVFHSMLTQGHVSINRFLSTSRSYLGLFRARGLRVFVEIAGEWRLLDTPSAFEMSSNACRWIYSYPHGLIEVRSAACSEPHELTLDIEAREGPAVRWLIVLHVALGGDDGDAPARVSWRREGEGMAVTPPEGSELHRRFSNGSFRVGPAPGGRFAQVAGDELLFEDRRSRQQPYICIVTPEGRSSGLRIQGCLLGAAASPRAAAVPKVDELPELRIEPPSDEPEAVRVRQLADIAPWFVHDALVHFLSPRGLEQFSGGGWGVRDVCQGPVELLLAHARPEPARDLLLRVISAQNPDGDWPQWFMFFDRDRDIRAADSHGDVVFWPILALAQYIIASGDASILRETAPFYVSRGSQTRQATVWEHVERALAVVGGRLLPGTQLCAYGHGDWNDSLQPADPRMRERMCSSWTVTLHKQTLDALARALRIAGCAGDAERFEDQAQAVSQDFQKWLLPDGVLAGYALFDRSEAGYLLHPRDGVSGVKYSSLAMVHAILEDMLTPEQARSHLNLIEERLCGPDGLRLFDRPMPYRGGPQRLFQRAESAAFFGREIGLMYMHAHLRYAQALAHMGEAGRFFQALCQANPIGLRALVPASNLRQSNCYYSSSDAAFADRYEATAAYERALRGEVTLEGGWRVYSSGPGIAIALIMRCFLGFTQEHDALLVDPVIPAKLNGMRARLSLYGRPVQVRYEVRDPGCGVTRVVVNGVQAPFGRDENPYRPGAARIAKDELLALLRSNRNEAVVGVGAGGG